MTAAVESVWSVSPIVTRDSMTAVYARLHGQKRSCLSQMTADAVLHLVGSHLLS